MSLDNENDVQNSNFQGRVNINLMKNIPKDEDNKKPPMKKRRVLRYILVFILLTLLPLIGKYIFIWVNAEKKIKYELQRFEDDGISLNIEDYAPEPVPDEENSAIILAEAFEKLTEDEEALAEISSFITGEPKDKVIDKDLIKKYVDENAECIEIVKKAMKRPKCRYDVDYSSNFDDLPHAEKIVYLEKIILSQAIFYIEEKNQEKAVEYLLLGLKLAGTLRDEPLLIPQAVLIISHEFLNHITKRILEEFSLTDDQSQRLIDEITKHTQIGLGKSIIVEFLLSHKNYYKPVCDGDIEPNQNRSPWFYFPALRKQDYGIVLEHMHDDIDLHKLPPGASKLIESDMLKLKRDTYDYPRFAIVSRLYYPIYGGIENDSTLRLARLEMARAALAIQIYYNRNKKLPKTLAELVEQKILDKEPVDPFKEDVLTYLKIDEKTYKLYTISINLIDDGGVTIDANNEDDYAWKITLPE